jgi:hypothetical protein
MPLPKIDLPIYQCELPSTGKPIKFRPFSVKEEKILLTAQESEDPKQVILAIKQILTNCLVDVDVDKLAVFDFEYLLIVLRSKSVDNIVQFEIKDPDTEESVKLEVDISKVKVEKDPKHTNKVDLSPYSLFLKYPNIDEIDVLFKKDSESSAEDNYNILISCLDKLVLEDDVYLFKDFSKKEVDEFVESLGSDIIIKIRNFFETMPKVRHEVPYINSKGENKTFVLQGTQSFFI